MFLQHVLSHTSWTALFFSAAARLSRGLDIDPQCGVRFYRRSMYCVAVLVGGSGVFHNVLGLAWHGRRQPRPMIHRRPRCLERRSRSASNRSNYHDIRWLKSLCNIAANEHHSLRGRQAIFRVQSFLRMQTLPNIIALNASYTCIQSKAEGQRMWKKTQNKHVTHLQHNRARKTDCT